MQHARLVLSEGDWISVPLPKGRDPSWTVAEEYAYSACYASALRRKFTEKRATSTAEAYVLRRLYPGLRFDAAMERALHFLIVE